MFIQSMEHFTHLNSPHLSKIGRRHFAAFQAHNILQRWRFNKVQCRFSLKFSSKIANGCVHIASLCTYIASVCRHIATVCRYIASAFKLYCILIIIYCIKRLLYCIMRLKYIVGLYSPNQRVYGWIHFRLNIPCSAWVLHGKNQPQEAVWIGTKPRGLSSLVHAGQEQQTLQTWCCR